MKLKDISTRAPENVDKEASKAELKEILAELNDLQNLLYANGKHSVLVILQGMDASGKDGLIKDVFTAMNPQGVQVSSFKAPTSEELGHDFLWRIHKQTPEKGYIKIFNRSHYEDILVTRVNGWIDQQQTEQRVQAINNFEKLLQQHGSTILLKFYLHISKEEQAQRLAERLVNPQKMWKYNANDALVAEKWDDYQRVYEDAFMQCQDPAWHIVPSDQNWYKSYYVAKTLRDALKDLNMEYPSIPTN